MYSRVRVWRTLEYVLPGCGAPKTCNPKFIPVGPTAVQNIERMLKMLTDRIFKLKLDA